MTTILPTHLVIPTTPPVKASYWLADLHNDLPAEYIDSTLFTHLFCGYAYIDADTYEVKISCSNQDQFKNFTTKVQASNIDVQTLLSIGGKKADKTVFASMASDVDNRTKFIDSSINLARDNNFYGLDLAWEYPSNDVEMANFGTLLVEWQKALQKESKDTQRVPLMLTAAVYYSPVYDSAEYPVGDISPNVDFVNIMAFDFYGPGWSSVTGPPGALYDSSANKAGRSGSSGLSEWLTAGLPKETAIFGFPLSGWAWTLKDAQVNGYDAATTGAAISGDGFITYQDVRNYIVNHGASTFYDPSTIGYYCFFGSTWIGYDDNQSIVSKVKYVKEQGLRGYFAWHVGADYKCGLSRAASVEWGPAT